jgi:drug/metabolite transporter (DMT)-like permease
MSYFFPILYACVSSTLSIANKYALLYFPYAGLLTACQFLFTAISVVVLGKMGFIELKPFDFEMFKKATPITFVFYASIFTNTKLLQNANIETFIAFRSSTPLLVCLFDTLVRKTPLPSKRTICALFGIALGAALYAQIDSSAITLVAYGWAFAYLLIITCEMVYAKHIASSIGLNTWGLVMYQNMISVLIWPFISLCTGEAVQIAAFVHTPPETSALLPVALTCVLGVAISFAGWGTRSKLSATSFTVLGVACKLATVGMNLTVWDHHSSYAAQAPILLCMFSSVAYQQSAKRDRVEREQAEAAQAEAAQVELTSKNEDLA